MKKLWKMAIDCGRQGSLSGVFVATQGEIDGLMGREVYFGEVLGKHSEVVIDFAPEDVKLLTDDQDFIAKAEEYGMASVGLNPFHYIEMMDEEEYE